MVPKYSAEKSSRRKHQGTVAMPQTWARTQDLKKGWEYTCKPYPARPLLLDTHAIVQR